jgi:hypothetical protein
MSEDLILKPEEVARRRNEIKKVDIVAEEPVEIMNTAGLVKIEYESQGRFATPPVLYFDDFLGRHLNEIELSTQDNLLETVITILNDVKKNEPDFNVVDMTAEDLLETLIGIKQQFEGNTHVHYWVCDCQMEKTDKDRILNEYIINLSDLQYKSMSQIDEEMKEHLSYRFAELTDEEFKSYLLKKYKNNPLDDIDSYTREQEIAKIVVKEPFNIISDNDVYTIRYPRLGDVIKAKKYADKIYIPKLKTIQNRKEANVPLHELKAKKEEEIKNLKEEQAKQIILYAKSMMLISKNGVALSDNDKFIEFKDHMKRKTFNHIEELFDNINFGLQTEAELVCPICGETEKGLLRDFLDPRQLLPLNTKSSYNRDVAKRESKNSSGFNFYFGV